MRFSEKLEQRYTEEIQSWNWEEIESQVYDYLHADECGDVVGSVWVGEQTAIFPSGKIYALWTTNQTLRDVIRDQAFSAALETVAENHGFYIDCEDGVRLARCLDPGNECFFTEDSETFTRNGQPVADTAIELEELMDSEGYFPNIYQLDAQGDISGMFDLQEAIAELVDQAHSDALAIQAEIDSIVNFAWPGGYPVLYVVESQYQGCAILCPGCVRNELKTGDIEPGQATAGVQWEGPPEICEGCNAEIESAYGDPDDHSNHENENVSGCPICDDRQLEDTPITQCKCETGEWSGSLNPDDPDNSWICDDCGKTIKATDHKGMS